MISKYKIVCMLLVSALIVGCASGSFSAGKRSLEAGQYELAIEYFRAAIEQDPEKPEVWRKLGIAYFRLNDYPWALKAFKQASLLDPQEGVSVLYRGVIHEKNGDFETARTLYRTYLKLCSNDELSRLLRYRLRWIEDQQLSQIVKKAAVDEKDIDVSSIPPNSAAVVRFDATALPAQYAPLGRGIAELLYHNLSYVEGLTLVERMQLPRLRQELELSKSEFSDKYSSPRIGRIVGAAKIITGILGQSDDSRLSIESSIVDVGPGMTEYPGSLEGDINEFIKLQKLLSFDVIEMLGYEITPFIKNKIDSVPTESYLALIAYSRGLEYADQGLYALAEAEFNAALAEDPGFYLATEALERYGGLIGYDGALRPIMEVVDLVERETVVLEMQVDDQGYILKKLQQPIVEEDEPYTTPQISGGRVIITGRTEQ